MPSDRHYGFRRLHNSFLQRHIGVWAGKGLEVRWNYAWISSNLAKTFCAPNIPLQICKFFSQKKHGDQKKVFMFRIHWNVSVSPKSLRLSGTKQILKTRSLHWMKPLLRKPLRPRSTPIAFSPLGMLYFRFFAVDSRLCYFSFGLRDSCHVAAACVAATQSSKIVFGVAFEEKGL